MEFAEEIMNELEKEGYTTEVLHKIVNDFTCGSTNAITEEDRKLMDDFEAFLASQENE